MRSLNRTIPISDRNRLEKLVVTESSHQITVENIFGLPKSSRKFKVFQTYTQRSFLGGAEKVGYGVIKSN